MSGKELPVLRQKKSPGFSGAFRRSIGLSLFIELEDMVPIDETVDEGFEIFRPGVAVVDVIGVLPDIDAQDRRRAVDKRVLAVRGLRDRQLALLDRDPGPARAELGGSSGDE